MTRDPWTDHALQIIESRRSHDSLQPERGALNLRGVSFDAEESEPACERVSAADTARKSRTTRSKEVGNG